LQAAIAQHRDRLAVAGAVYPARWGRKGDDTHNELTDMMRSAQKGEGGFEDLEELLERHGNEDVLLSSESLTQWVLREERLEVLLTLLSVARSAAPVRCVWTLRRFDDVAHSLCLQMLLAGLLRHSPVEYMEGFPIADMFTNMRRVEEAVHGDAVYVKYDRSGAHNKQLLAAFGLSTNVAGAVESALGMSSRLNVSGTHKEVAARINAEELSARSGVELREDALSECFGGGEFRFHDDGPCELVGRGVREELHERALAAAHETGFGPYLRFFGEEKLEAMPERATLDADVLSGEDLERLAGRLGQLPQNRDQSSPASDRAGLRRVGQ
jgi:hypothetical protein